MRESVSQFLGFTEQEIRDIAESENIRIPKNVNVLDELRNEHRVAIAA